MIKPLTSFRFFAALAVFFSHLAIMENFKHTKQIYQQFFYEGYIGVTFFFILSGFILTYTYYKVFDTINKEKLQRFYQSRLARIYPLYLLTFIISVPLAGLFSNENIFKTIGSSIVNILMIQSFVPSKEIYFGFNSPAWSLSNEMFFYALLPIILLSIHKIKKHLNSSILFSAICFIWLLALTIVFLNRDSDLSHWLFYISPLFRTFDFVIGIVLGIMFLEKIKKPINRDVKVYTFYEISTLILLLIALFFSPEVHQSFRYGTYYLPAMALIIWVFSFQAGFISRFLSNKVFIYLGEISFAFYLIHQLVIRYLHAVPKLDSYPILFAVVALFISLISSHFVSKLYETPSRKWIKNLSLNPFTKNRKLKWITLNRG